MRKVSSRRRSSTDIIHDILSLCQIPRKKTCIMYQSNLSYQQLQRYIKMLILEEMLGELEVDGKPFFQTTESGKTFVEEYKRFGLIMEGIRR